MGNNYFNPYPQLQLSLIEFNYSADNTKWGTEDERIATLSFVLLDKNKNKNWERKEWKAFRDLVNTKQLRRCGKRVSIDSRMSLNYLFCNILDFFL